MNGKTSKKRRRRLSAEEMTFIITIIFLQFWSLEEGGGRGKIFNKDFVGF